MSSSNYRIIDLFAGIGGIRLGFEKHGCKSVFSSEWDEHAKKIYKDNEKVNEILNGIEIK